MRWVELARATLLAIACSACGSASTAEEAEGSVEGTVLRVQERDAELSLEGGRTLRVTLHPVLASQLHQGDRIRADVRRGPGGTDEVSSLEFVERAPTSEEVSAGGGVLSARDLPSTGGTVRVGAGQD